MIYNFYFPLLPTFSKISTFLFYNLLKKEYLKSLPDCKSYTQSTFTAKVFTSD